MRIQRNSVQVEVESGWEAELLDHPGGRAVLHLSDSQLPTDRSDFGGHAIEHLTGGRLFVAVLEYHPDDANRGVFHHQGMPHFRAQDFSPNHLHRFVVGQTAAQKFFSWNGRAFCAYAVIGADPAPPGAVLRVNRSLGNVKVLDAQ